jgi:hypothetical protein
MDQGADGKVHRSGVHQGHAAGDDALAFEPLDAPPARCWCQIYMLGNLASRQASVALEQINDFPIN